MKAIRIVKYGGPEVLKLQDVEDSIPLENEVLIEVKASGINRSDILQRNGNYSAPDNAPADIPGLEVSGIVVSCGSKVTKWKRGDKVCCILSGGGYSQYVCVGEGQCLPIPKGLTFLEAASLPETVFTVWSNIFEQGRLQAGETLLVHGGTSGIGTTAIQIAHALGSKVFTSVGSEAKAEFCHQLGADICVNYKTQDFETLLHNEGVDVILDMRAGEYFQKNLNILHSDGRLVHINSEGGDAVNLSIWQLMIKRLTITGSTLRGRDYKYKTQLANSVYNYVWPLIEEKKFKPVIYKTFPVSEVSQAHICLEEGKHIGKIVLDWN